MCRSPSSVEPALLRFAVESTLVCGTGCGARITGEDVLARATAPDCVGCSVDDLSNVMEGRFACALDARCFLCVRFRQGGGVASANTEISLRLLALACILSIDLICFSACVDAVAKSSAARCDHSALVVLIDSMQPLHLRITARMRSARFSSPLNPHRLAKRRSDSASSGNSSTNVRTASLAPNGMGGSDPAFRFLLEECAESRSVCPL
mmetsp:Transcript_1243/g.3468  ORF Transcript_1243/g.3468 Transcript_1243/m.3468 type:complete len:209 (+) Transcript_1243:3138-3764(+)